MIQGGKNVFRTQQDKCKLTGVIQQHMQDLYKPKPEMEMESGHRASPLATTLSAIVHCLERERQFSLRM